MATASSVGGSLLSCSTGDNGTIFNQVEAASTAVKERKDSLQSTHPGFNNKILLYNTITDAWFEAGETNNPPVAVTADVSDGSNVYIASGEIRPGVRSPHITQLHYTSRSSFGWLNYLVLLVYFGGMLWIGFFFMKRNENTEDFFKASGRIPWWAAGISIFATTLSAITFLSIPAKTYATDWRMLIFNIAIILIVPFVIKYFIPFFRRFNLGTAYEYLEMRFSRAVRWLASALFVIFMVSRIAIVLFLPALALNAVTGFDIYLSIIVMGIVTIIYSTSGGMEAVVWGDVVQGFILVFGAITAFVVMIVGIEGGIGEFWSTSIEFHKFRTFDFRFDFTQPVFWVSSYRWCRQLHDHLYQRPVHRATLHEHERRKSYCTEHLAERDTERAGHHPVLPDRDGYSASTPTTPPACRSPQYRLGIPTVHRVGDAGRVRGVADSDHLRGGHVHPLVNINSSAAVITSDFFQTVFPKSSFTSRLKVARWSGILCGLLGLGMALVLATWNIASLWDQFNTFLGLLTSGLGALFILGVFFPRVDSKAALIGVIGGLIVLVFIKNNTPFSFLLYGFFGMAASIVIAVAMSWFSPNKKKITGLTWKTICKIPLEK